MQPFKRQLQVSGIYNVRLNILALSFQRLTQTTLTTNVNRLKFVFPGYVRQTACAPSWK